MNFVNNRILNFISLCSITGLDLFFFFFFGGGEGGSIDVPVRFISFRPRKIYQHLCIG